MMYQTVNHKRVIMTNASRCDNFLSRFVRNILTNLTILIGLSLLVSVTIVVVADTTTTTNNEDNKDNDSSSHYYLNENSVVLITGAAGFIGSELAMALARTYNVKKLICIDRMDRGFGIPKPNNNNKKHTKHDENELALFEFKRQRLFRLLQQTSNSDGSNTKVYFYRVDFRPSIPEYFDSTEVPVLHYIFTKEHPDITHVVHLADHYHRTGMEVPTNGSSIIPTHQQVIPRVKGGEKAGMMESLLEEIRLFQYNNPTKKQPHFVYASSSEVYDSFNNHEHERVNPSPFHEHLPITIPSTIAGTSKLIDEILAQTYNDITPNQLKSIGLRFFTVYGPWGLPGSSLFEMAEAAIQNVDADTSTSSSGGGGSSSTNNGQQTTTRSILTKNSIPIELLDDIKDYCYIDDAIDAIMAAMQFEPPKSNPTIVFNVGSGEGNTLRSIAQTMNDIVQAGGTSSTATADEDYEVRKPITTSIANLDRIKTVLRYGSQIALKDGLEQTLAWHYDRTFPYGTGANVDTNQYPKHISQKGMVACESIYDLECLKGNPVFPCSSECSNPNQCISTLYDDVMELTRYITMECTTVMYTVSLDTELRDIPSIHYQVSSQSIPYVQDGGGFCNIAFVADKSPLFIDQASKTARRVIMNDAKSEIDQGSIIKYGFWTLIPVAVTDYVISNRYTNSNNNRNTTTLSVAHNREILEMIPKLSPTLFFGNKVEHAIYCDIDIVFDSIPRLLKEANMQPQQKTKSSKTSNDNTRGVTVMMIGKHSKNNNQERKVFTNTRNRSSPPYQSIQQEIAYRTIRMAVIDEMMGDGFAQTVDSSFIVNNLFQRRHPHSSDASSTNNNNDSKFFRCDILGEIIQWNVPTDNAAIEFIMSLHDMWSRIMVEKNHIQPWWIGNDVITIPSDIYKDSDLEKLFGHINKQTKQNHRRLQEIDVLDHSTDITKMSEQRNEELENQNQHSISRRLQVVEEDEFGGGTDTAEKSNVAEVEEDTDDDDGDLASNTDKDETTVVDDHNGFGVVQDAIQAVFGGGARTTTAASSSSDTKQSVTGAAQHKKVERFAQPDDEKSSSGHDSSSTEIDDFVVNDDDNTSNDDDDTTTTVGGGEKAHHRQQHLESLQRLSSSRFINNNIQQEDLSSYDVWMGILSSTNIRYFSRIVSMQAVGAYRLSDYDKE